MRLSDRTLLFSIDDILGDKNIENKVTNILSKCKKKFFRDFEVVLFYEKSSKTQVNKFIKTYSKTLDGITFKVTNSKLNYSWFVINLDDKVATWRYLYKGINVIDGLKSYVSILEHIQRKDK